MIKGMSNIEVRILNRKNILNVLYRYGAMTKQDIASILGISPPTVSVLVNDLSEKGLVAAQGAMDSTGGRRPALIAVVNNSRYAFGADISQNDVRFVLITLSAEEVAEKKITVEFNNTNEYWTAFAENFNEFIQDAQINKELLLGVGISLPSKIQSDEKLIKNELSEILGFEVEIGNDTKMAALAQVWNRIEPDPAVYVSLDKEVGGAIISGYPEIFYGVENAGQFGHMTIENKGKSCTCGQEGCFDAYCSTRSLEIEAGTDIPTFFAKLQEGDQVAESVWDKYLEYLSVAINNLYVIFRSVIIIGGEMSEHVKEYKDDLKKKLEKRNPFRGPIDYLRISDYGENDSAFGAALSLVSRFLM